MPINELNKKAADYFAIQQMIAELTEQAEAIKDQMKAVMVENSTEEISGTGWRATWHNTTTSRFDTAAFKKAHADLYTAFTKTTTGTRFTLNSVKA